MSVQQSLEHKWMSQDVKYMRAKRLSTAKHKRFMARRKWQVRYVTTCLVLNVWTQIPKSALTLPILSHLYSLV